ncbi:ATP-binding cassette domain-containing protein [Bacillus altitudinis]|uniref:ATP-binding cassette domain-containing protein n=1 Tax=Bacillus altitudinis TaxID=293387 RepID=UPI001653EC9C|nr:ATP-binding cassette domain-containing protein [Bacillus altitudinis]
MILENSIVLEDVSKKIKGQYVLKQINLHLNRGKIYGLKGKNGSGKTMLLRAISGLIRINSGKITVMDKVLTKENEFPDSIGVLIETPGFIPEYTGLKNLKLLSMIKNIIGDLEMKKSLADVGLDPEDKRKFRQFSLGMKQRLGIAQAIMEKPDVILLDEPSNALDEEGMKQLNKVLLELRNGGATIVIASHDSKMLEEISDEIFEIERGELRLNQEVVE